MGPLLTFLGFALIVLGVLGVVLAVFGGSGRYAVPGGFIGPVVLIIVGVGLLLLPVA